MIELSYDPALRRWRYQGSVSAGQTSEPLLIKVRGFGPVSAAVFPTGGAQAVIQATLSPDPDSGNWLDWDKGAVTSASADALQGPVTALRCSVTGTGSAVWEVMA